MPAFTHKGCQLTNEEVSHTQRTSNNVPEGVWLLSQTLPNNMVKKNNKILQIYVCYGNEVLLIHNTPELMVHTSTGLWPRRLEFVSCGKPKVNIDLFQFTSECLRRGWSGCWGLKNHVPQKYSLPHHHLSSTSFQTTIQPHFDWLPCSTVGWSGGTQWRSYLEGTVHQLGANRLTHLHNAPLWDGPED